MKNILTLNNISKSFDNNEILKDITLDIEKGKIISLLGKSGSGKSTLLNIIAGFEQSKTGILCLNNKILSDQKIFIEPQKRNIGFVFQNYALFPHMTIFDNITFGIENYQKEEKNKIAKELLELVHLSGYEKRYPHELSGGQQQRVALIRAMALNPELILLDEPFSGIDTMLKSQIQKELLQILKSTHKTAIIVTHDSSEAMAMSDKIIYLEDGKIMQYDTPVNIYKKPKTKNIAKSFGIANFIKKDDIEYCVRVDECRLSDEAGEYKVSIVSQSFQGDKYILDVQFDNNIFTVYSPVCLSDENLFLSISWDDVVEVT
ncbi:ATP-binding cassette domain-containing protein [Arcobacter sp. 15-2]|uniref:ABC transporter ATP-binding protein n=1 Tax=Arcobacter sp. 15-2 TaxID=3374109 RepID=UPI00399CD4D8